MRLGKNMSHLTILMTREASNRILFVVLSVLLGLANAPTILGQPTATVDPGRLSAQIEAGTQAIWSNMKVKVTINGCTYRQVKDYDVQDLRTQGVIELDLANLETDPSKVFREGQLMGDDTGRTWWTFNIVYHWNKDFLARNADDVAAWTRDHEKLNRQFDEQTSDNLTDQEYQAVVQKFSDVAEAMYRDLKNGRYGDDLGQNFEVATTWNKDGRSFYLYPILDTDDRNFSYLSFVLNDDVADQILADIHAYTQAHCPG